MDGGMGKGTTRGGGVKICKMCINILNIHCYCIKGNDAAFRFSIVL